MNASESDAGTAPTVFVVDDDQGVRKALHALASASGLAVETFASADEFLAQLDPRRPGCLVLDIRLGSVSGLDLQDDLRQRGCTMPVIMITAYGNVPTSVRAMRGGAIDFLQKPFPPRLLLDRIREAIDIDRENRAAARKRARIEARIASLTPREREIMELLVTTGTSKEIAQKLDLSVRTVEGHRREVLRKMEVGSATQLVRALSLIGR